MNIAHLSSTNESYKNKLWTIFLMFYKEKRDASSLPDIQSVTYRQDISRYIEEFYRYCIPIDATLSGDQHSLYQNFHVRNFASLMLKCKEYLEGNNDVIDLSLVVNKAATDIVADIRQ